MLVWALLEAESTKNEALHCFGGTTDCDFAETSQGRELSWHLLQAGVHQILKRHAQGIAEYDFSS